MSDPASQGVAARALAWLHALEDIVLALLLGAMVLLAPLQIFLRNFFDLGIAWADPLLRVLVLWVGLLGAVAASRGNRQISVDVVSRLLAPRPQAALGVVTGAFTTFVSAFVAWQAARFVATEFQYESIAFSDIQAWIFQIVIPFSFGAIALRYALYTIVDAAVALGLREPSDDGPHGIGSAATEEGHAS
ncbi:MAG: TRAP transporter small permease subunit [Deltaproteobacteria bacterium]|nr:TRAP transporter small permease subunit [Deltaproteobacteria bacterium]MBW2382496.1 TRAP transporter small permease subunit [Deltaproteobacteria bacterium]MBW2694977.1 TRAP transporter small permease subunit [Deltaproteobacteria bacterium]